VKPFLDRSVERQAAYVQILQPSASLQIVPVNRDVLVAAARLRAETNMKLPDAIHAATARLTGCAQFLTNDAHVKTVPGLTILSLAQL
jgi:predicted nucleic acid-binding protein